MAAPNHATLGLHLGEDPVEMLKVFELSATSLSKLINNQWDTAIAKDSKGMPTISSHHGMHMVAWHIPLALSGQAADLPKGSLTHKPKVAPPYALPIFLPGVVGQLSSPAAGHYSVRLTVGELWLDVLSVDGVRAPPTQGRVRLVAGAAPTVCGRAGG